MTDSFDETFEAESACHIAISVSAHGESVIVTASDPTFAYRDDGRDTVVSCMLDEAQVAQLHEYLARWLAHRSGAKPACDPPNACATHGRCWTHSEWEDERLAREAGEAGEHVRMVRCARCDGRGSFDRGDGPEDCERCGGEGLERLSPLDALSRMTEDAGGYAAQDDPPLAPGIGTPEWQERYREKWGVTPVFIDLTELRKDPRHTSALHVFGEYATRHEAHLELEARVAKLEEHVRQLGERLLQLGHRVRQL